MNKFNQLFSLVSLIFLIFFTGCNKRDETNPVSPVYIPGTLKQYGLFQSGSFWIFKNEKSQVSDCSWISKNPILQYKEFTFDSVLTLVEFTEIYYGGSHFTQFELTPYYYFAHLQHGFGSQCLRADGFYPGYIRHETPYSTFQTMECLDVMKVNDKTYDSVIHSRVTEIFSLPDTVLYDYWLAKNVGVIRFRLFHSFDNRADTTWSLLRYRVLNP